MEEVLGAQCCHPAPWMRYTPLSRAGGSRTGETSWGGDSDSKTTHGPLRRNKIG